MAQDYSGVKKMLSDMLEKKKSDKEAEDKQRQAKNEEDRNKILENVAGDLAKSIQPVLKEFAETSKLSPEDIRQALVDAIQINLPEIQMPEIPAPIVNVPAPIVRVDAPIIPAPIVKVSPTPVTFPSEMSLKAGNRPFPVIMMDQAGKPLMFPQSMGASGGKADFFTIKDIQTSSGASLIDQVEGALKVTGTFSVTSSATSTLAQLVNADGTAYDSDHPLPTTATISLPAGQGDSATATRIIQAGDSVSSVIVNSGTITTVSAVTGITNTVNVRLDSPDGPYSAANPLPTTATISLPAGQGDEATATRVVQAGNSVSSVVVNSGTITAVTGITNSVAVVNLDRDGNPAAAWQVYPGATGLNETNANVLRTVLMTDSVASVVVNSGTITTVTTVTGITNSIAVVGEIASDVADTGNAPVKIGGIARTANPTAVAAGDRVSASMDDLGRQIVRPVQVRDLTVTAYASIANGTETTLLAATAGAMHDLVYLILANSSDAAVLVDVRGVTAGNIFTTLAVPANGTVGISLGAMPAPASAADTGNNWTIDMPDITGTTVYATGLFSREV